MNEHFRNIIASANANKEQFDGSLEVIKDSLHASIANAAPEAVKAPATTGWLKGSLSYPWVLVCSIVPTLKDIF